MRHSQTPYAVYIVSGIPGAGKREWNSCQVPGLGVIILIIFQDVRLNQAVGAVPGAEPSLGLYWVLRLPGGHGIWI